MPALNYNYNYNYNYAAGGGGGGGGRRFRERFNTDYYTRLSVQPPMINPFLVPLPNYTNPQTGILQYRLFEQNWTPDLRAYVYLEAFRQRVGLNWRLHYDTLIRTRLTPPHEMNQNTLNGQIMRMLDLSLEREPRFCEIIDQDDGDGAINYLLGMLEIDPARHPHTKLMVSIGRRIGEFVVMCLKDNYRSPRPSQLSPAIIPMIDPPVTPAFPAGHAVQAYLISYLIAYSLDSSNTTGVPRLPNHRLPANPSITNQATGLLFDLAARISENRVVAGLHYPVDIEAGIAIAIRCFRDIRSTALIWDQDRVNVTAGSEGLNKAAATEFPQYA